MNQRSTAGAPRGAPDSRHEASPAISAILPLRNKKAFVDSCIESVHAAATRHGGVEIVVVDNGSDDGSLEALSRWRGQLTVRHCSAATIAAVRNAGASAARAPVLAFIDADCVVSPDYFVALTRVFAEQAADATGFEVRLPETGSWVEVVWGALHTRADDGARHYLNSANFAVRRGAFDAIGGFDERLVTGEDTDIGLRLTAAGFRLWATKTLEVVHLDNPRTLPDFFRKERWRGAGALTQSILSLRRRSVIAVTAFGLTLAAGLATLALPLPLGLRLALGALVMLAVPAASAAYRMIQSKRVVSPVRATVLYAVYYLARLTALLEATANPARQRPGHPAVTATAQPPGK